MKQELAYVLALLDGASSGIDPENEVFNLDTAADVLAEAKERLEKLLVQAGGSHGDIMAAHHQLQMRYNSDDRNVEELLRR